MVATMLETIGLTKRFGGLFANTDINLAIAQGEIRGLIGPNGAGKTTFINLLTGVEEPSSGDIQLGGSTLLRQAPYARARRGLLRTFQIPKLFRNMTVFENLLIQHFASGDGTQRDARLRADGLLDMAGLTRLRDSPASHLSGGQQALLQLLGGFMVEGLRCYLLDEPFAGVNPIVKETMVELIQRHNRSRGITFLLVSHEMSVIRQLCSSVTVLAEGKVLIEGTLDEVTANAQVIDAYLGKTWS